MEIWYGLRIALRKHFFLIAKFYCFDRNALGRCEAWNEDGSFGDFLEVCGGRADVQIRNSDALTSPCERATFAWIRTRSADIVYVLTDSEKF